VQTVEAVSRCGVVAPRRRFVGGCSTGAKMTERDSGTRNGPSRKPPTESRRHRGIALGHLGPASAQLALRRANDALTLSPLRSHLRRDQTGASNATQGHLRTGHRSNASATPLCFLALGASKPAASHLFGRFPRAKSAALVPESPVTLRDSALSVCNSALSVCDSALTLYKDDIPSLQERTGSMRPCIRTLLRRIGRLQRRIGRLQRCNRPARRCSG